MISLDGVTFTYPNGTRALNGIDLEVRRDEALFILGHNGAGKSTLLRLLNGLLKPTSGTVRVDGRDTRRARTAVLARTVGLVFQDPDTQLFQQRVRDEVHFGAVHAASDGTAGARTDQAMDLLGLHPVADENPYDLSLSVRKRVTVASVFAMGSPVIVLDEPTGGQDVEGTTLLTAAITAARAAGRAIVVVTHDVELAFDHADRVIVLADGAIHVEGPPTEILGHPRLPEAGVHRSTMHVIWQELGLPDPVGDVERLFRLLPVRRGARR